jgi:hypothetical protein
MIFWLLLLIGCFFAWFGFRLRLYVSWIIFFNLVISIYAGIMVTPWLVGSISELQRSPYSTIALMVVIPVVLMIFLSFIARSFFMDRLDITFPARIELIFSALTGFLTGYLASAYLITVISFLPILKGGKIDSFTSKNGKNPSYIQAVKMTCSIVNKFSLQFADNTKNAFVILKSYTQESPDGNDKSFSNQGESSYNKGRLQTGSDGDPNGI